MSATVDEASEALSPNALDQRFRRPLLSYFRRRTSDWTEAEDLTQQTFLRIYEISAGAPAARAQTFVFSVAAFLLKEHRSRERTRGATRAARPENIEVAQAAEVSDGSSPERALLDRDDLKTALRLLDELGPRTRDIYLLFRVEGLRRKQIADLYDISVSAVEKHVLKAATHLARGLNRP